MKWIFFFPAFFCFVAQGQNFSASAIPDSLSRNADVVLRQSETIVEVHSPARRTIRQKYTYTILNETGKDYAEIGAFYDKRISISSLEGAMYDAAGKLVQRMHKKDLIDRPYSEQSELVSDSRVKFYRFAGASYPYTVSFEQEDDATAITELPDWDVYPDFDVSVENSRFVVIVPAAYELRYRAMNGASAPSISRSPAKTTYTWEAHNLPARKKEPYAPQPKEFMPRVLIAPSDFEDEGYAGNMRTWNDYGKFYAALLKGRDALPDAVRATVHRLTDGEPDPRKKIALLYDYLQRNTHYIAIELGIGGFQPFPAAEVAQKQYGDCKGLSNYMAAMLKEAGIRAYSVIIKAGRHEKIVAPDFVADQFNHVICCVPLTRDTVWLECTANWLSPGYLSGFTADRDALLVLDDGGLLVHTPRYGEKENTSFRRVDGKLAENGDLSFRSVARLRAGCQDDLCMELHDEPRDKQLERLRRGLGLATYDVLDFHYTQRTAERLPEIEEDLSIDARNYAQVSGRRIFLNPGVIAGGEDKPINACDSPRRYGVDIRDGFQTSDSVVIRLPDGYLPESMPPDVVLDTRFGSYRAEAKIAGGTLVFYRGFLQHKAQYPPADYCDFVKFRQDIYKADHRRIVLVRKS